MLCVGSMGAPRIRRIFEVQCVTMRLDYRPALICMAALVVLFSATGTAAQAQGLLDNIENDYAAATGTWLTAAMGWARVIFVGLVVLELTWSILEIFLRNRDAESFLNSLIIRIISIGAAIFILSIAPSIVLPLIQDFTNIGASIASAGGYPAATTPNGVFGVGIQIANELGKNDIGQQFTTFLTMVIPTIVSELLVLFAFGIVAGQLLLTLIQIYIVVGGGAFLLGFIGSRWTMPFAEKYPAMVISSGLKLVVITLIVGLGKSLGDHWIAQAAQPNPSAVTMLTIGAETTIYAIIAWNIPNFIAAMAGASPALSFSSLVAGTASIASRAAAGGASGGAAGAAGAASGAAAGGGIGAIERAAQTN